MHFRYFIIFEDYPSSDVELFKEWFLLRMRERIESAKKKKNEKNEKDSGDKVVETIPQQPVSFETIFPKYGNVLL